LFVLLIAIAGFNLSPFATIGLVAAACAVQVFLDLWGRQRF
jgi:hypothetical protein